MVNRPALADEGGGLLRKAADQAGTGSGAAFAVSLVGKEGSRRAFA